MKALNIGQSDFKNVITRKNYFIDKSLLIEDVIRAPKNVLLLPRPRRFGKTLNLSMLRYFFDNSNANYKELFQDLKISNCSEDILTHCNRYPTIYLTFKDSKAQTWNETFSYIKEQIASAYRQHIYLLDSDKLYSFEKERFLNTLNGTAKDTEYGSSLSELSRYLNTFHQEDVVILIDEYDTPIQAGRYAFYNDAISFMRTVLSGAFKDNPYLYKGVITGILRVSKESIFTGLNNISVHSILDNRFSDKFGFTEQEIKQLLLDFNLEHNYNNIKQWYNGYNFGTSQNIYNPWSILSYITENTDGFKPFWANTSSNELIKEQVKQKDANLIREDILRLISGGTIIHELEENFVFPDLDKDKNLLWTLLTHSGYLTPIRKTSNFQPEYELRIPNLEVKTVFRKTILDWLVRDVKIEQTLLFQTFQHLIQQQLPAFEKGFQQIIGDTFSYYDTAKNNEYVYHAYLLGLLAVIGDDYIIKSNKESGDGRYDILLVPHDKTKTGIVIEIKQIEKQQKKESDLLFTQRTNTEINSALAQINRNQYYFELIENKIPETNILKVPIVFAGKSVFVLEQ